MTRRPASLAACAASVVLLAACSSRVCEPTNGASCGTEPSDLAPTAHHTGAPQPANGKASIAKPASSAEASTDAPPDEDLEIQELREGTGAVAGTDSRVIVRLRGALADGTVFDAADEPRGPWPVENLIEGLRIGIEGMREGGRRRVTIPPRLAYGDRAIELANGAGLPPNATLVYSIELIDVLDEDETEMTTEAEGGES